MQHALRESHETKDRFLATLAHELRNPITPILASVRVQRAKLADLGVRHVRAGRHLDGPRRRRARPRAHAGDNADIRDVLSEVLSTLGMTVFPAADGDAALRLAASERPEVCVIDLGLPGMTGYDLARRLRAMDAAPPRLIALTGYGTDGIERARAPPASTTT